MATETQTDLIVGDTRTDVKVIVENFCNEPIDMLSVNVLYPKRSIDITAFANGVRPEQKKFDLLIFDTGSNKPSTFKAQAGDRNATESWKLHSNDHIQVKVYDDSIEIERQPG